MKYGLFAFLFFYVSSVSASRFMVNPVSVSFSRGQASANLNVNNTGDTTTRFQIKVFQWSETPEGSTELVPSKDIVFFPSLLTVAPKEERNIRIGVVVPPSSIEKTYRILVKELPDASTDQQGSKLTLLTEFSVPIFVQPLEKKLLGSVEKIEIQKDKAFVTVANTGTVYFKTKKIKIEGEDAKRQKVYSTEIAGWYVLAQSVRRYELKLPEENCEKIKTLYVSVEVEDKLFTQQLSISPADCRK